MFLATRRRLFHKRILIVSLLFLLVCFVAFFFQWVYKPLVTNYAGPDFSTSSGGNPVTYRWHEICLGFQLDKWMTTIVNFTFPLLPLIPSIFIYNFIDEKSGYCINSYTRISNYKRFMWKSVGVHSLLSGVYFYILYLIFLGVGMVLSKTLFYDNTIYGIAVRKTVYSEWGIYPNYYTKSFLADIFGKYFFNYHPIEFYILFGFLATFIFGVVYGLFAISIAFLSDKNYLSVLLPFGYFVTGSILFSMLLNKFIMLSPISTFGGLVYSGSQPTYFSLLPLIGPFLFALIVIAVKINRGDKLGF